MQVCPAENLKAVLCKRTVIFVYRLCLPDIITCNEISQALCISIVQELKYWGWEQSYQTNTLGFGAVSRFMQPLLLHYLWDTVPHKRLQ